MPTIEPDDELDPPDQKPGFWHHVWYWIKLPIWYLIRDTECPYCIFLRGVLLGLILGIIPCLIFK